MNPWYTDYAEYLGRLFPGRKVQKLSVNTGRGCPNRDGTLGTGGCIYCDNRSFTPGYCFGAEGVRAQLEAGRRFFGRKYPSMRWLAYFQSFSSTYGAGTEELEADLGEALSVPDVEGLVIGTRPDCIGEPVLDLLERFSRRVPVIVELGVETLHDRTLRLINRGHDAAAALDAIERCAARGLHVGAHLMAGLPGESRRDMLDTVARVVAGPVESVKLHQLQVLRGTPLARMADEGMVTVTPFSVEEYLDFCVRVVALVPRRVAIERFTASAPPEMVIAPRWGMKNHEFTDLLHRRLRETIGTAAR